MERIHSSARVELSLDVCVQTLEAWRASDGLAAVIAASPWRREAAALYAFARHGNSIADAPGDDGDRVQKLDDWESQLEAAYHGRAEHPVFVALGHVVRGRDIPINPLRDLITSFRQDIAMRRPTTFAGLQMHCRLAAGSVARLAMRFAGESDPWVLDRAEDLAVGLRLVDILSDLDKDTQRGRRYLPAEDLVAFGVEEGNEATARDLINFQVARARTWLARGQPLMRVAGAEARALASALYWAADGRLAAIERGDDEPARPKISRDPPQAERGCL